MKTQTSTYLTRRTPATSAPVSPVPGHPCRVGHSPFGCFAHHSEDGWCVCEEQTGLTVGRGCTEAAAKSELSRK